MEFNEKMMERINNLRDTLNFIEPKKVPTFLLYTTWPFGYAGVKYKDVYDDPQTAAKYYTKFMDEIEIDISYFGGNRNTPIGAYKALGADLYEWAPDGVAITHRQTGEYFLGPEDYPMIVDDYEYVNNEYLVKKRFPIFNEPKEVVMKALKEAAEDVRKLQATNALAMEKVNEIGMITVLASGLHAAPSFVNPFNRIFDNLRGIPNALADLRRRPEQVIEACDAIMAVLAKGFTDDKEKIRKSFEGLPLVFGNTILHSEGFVADKWFDKFYFNNFKKYCEPYMECGAKYFVMGEGKFLRTLDRYQDLPKGSVWIQLDEDDPDEAFKVLGDYQTLCIGITYDVLKYGTEQQVKDTVKASIDKYAPGGGYVFMHNKCLLSPTDVNSDNVRTAYNYAAEYGRK